MGTHFTQAKDIKACYSLKGENKLNETKPVKESC